MIFGLNGVRIPGQGQPNWTPLQYLQNLSNFISGNQKAIAFLETNLPRALSDPAQLSGLLSYFVAWQTFRIVNWTLRTVRFILQTSPLLSPVVLNLAVTGLGGLAGLSGLAGLAQPAAPVPLVPAPVAASPGSPPVAVLAAPVMTPAPLPTPPVPAAEVGSVAAVPASPAPVPGAEGFAYLVGGPGPSFGPTLGARMAAAESTSETTAATTAAPTAERRAPTRAARRLRAPVGRGHRYEYLTADEHSGQGAGTVGFTGTVPKAELRPAGLSTLGGDAFGGSPRAPMLPGSWRDLSDGMTNP
ncbi:hypothetical protein AWC00_23520 [Mycobacterium conspicuum]|nr:hypothetical protein AWC00_23520 [Mycobacterium conspicuum]